MSDLECKVCDGGGMLTVPDSDGESASEQACPDPVHDGTVTATPGQAERDYAEFIRWWEAKGYHDGQQLDFSDARDAFASGMRAARAATQPHAATALPREQWAEPKAAPELADATAKSDRLEGQLEDVRAVAAEMLDAFGPSGSGHTARVGMVQIAKWRTRAGLTP